MSTLSKPRNIEYLGRRAQVQELRLKGTNGLRVSITRWIDSAAPENGGYVAGTVVLKLISGNFLTNPDAFRTFEIVEMEPPVRTDEAIDQANQLLKRGEPK